MRLLTRKPFVVLLAVAAGILLLAAGRGEWITGTVNGVAGPATAAAPGSEAAPGLAGLALVAMAAAVAATTTGRVGRWISTIALAAVGVGAIALALRAVLDASGVLGSVAAAQSGGTGTFEATGSATFWPWAAVVAGAALLVAAGGAFVGARRWGGLSSRYERPTGRSPGRDGGDDVGGARGERVDSAWDRVTRGDDPSVD